MFQLNESINLKEATNDILTAGEILVDMISTEYSDNFECDTYQKFFGGSPANIALNVKKLGIRPVIASAVGNDELGCFLVGRLQDAGIDTGLIQRADEATSMVLVTKSKSSPVPIFYRGADYQLAYTAELENALLHSKILHFSCWPLSRKPSRVTIEKLIATAKKHHVLVSFDPNYHPMLWEKGEDGVAYIKSVIRRADIIKPSEDDAERLFGEDIPENQMEKFLELGAGLVMMTLGKDGALVSNGKETLCMPSLAKEVTDTTGAGDAFWSGFYVAVIKGYTIQEALLSGMAVSAFKLKYTGAVVDLPELEAIRSMYAIREV